MNPAHEGIKFHRGMNGLTLSGQKALMMHIDSNQQRHKVQEGGGITSSIKSSFLNFNECR